MLRHMVILSVLFAAAAIAAPIEIWTPETGETTLDELPRETPEQRRKHALALLGAGQLSGGEPIIRELIQADPDADWVTGARMALSRALIAADQCYRAFDELQDIVAANAGTPVAVQARELQFRAAWAQAAADVDLGAALFDRLVEEAETSHEAARALKEKADAYFRAERYLDAQFDYLLLADNHPDSELRPYCYYRAAQCQWFLAEWLQLGLQQVEMAEEDLTAFAESFPHSEHAEDARRMAEEARTKRSELNWAIARFYTDVKGKPWAALNYLNHIVNEFPGSEAAEWAQEEIERIRGELEIPLRGEVRRMELPGVERVAGGP
jgi:outer membrane protein assembly factor BamD (BamD/ComL family)